jgi:O-antigen ligase
VLGVVAALSFALPPVRARVAEKAADMAGGDVNALLTGRLDGWRAAVWMLRSDPLTGVGQGAYRTEFAAARLALAADGTRFFERQHQVMFATPHNEVLSVAAEQGVPGLLALAWGIVIVIVAAARLQTRERRAFALAGLAALTVLCLLWFPLHLAAAAWPWLLFLAWVFRASETPA